jgi:hypothetical protein
MKNTNVPNCAMATKKCNSQLLAVPADLKSVAGCDDGLIAN